MRILQLHTRYRQRGGEDGVVDAEAELLRSAGHEVERLTADNPVSPTRTAAALLASPHNPIWARAVRRAIATFRPDVAHLHNTWYAMSPAVVEELRKANVPTVMTVHNYRLLCLNGYFLRDGRPCEDCLGRSPWPGVQHRCYHDSALASTAAATTLVYNRRRDTWGRGIALFLTPTAFVRDRLLAAGFPPAQVRVKPHFVADPGSRPAPPSRSQTVLYVGRLSPDKGAHVLLDAWSSMAPSELELVCIGDGPLRDHMSRRRVPQLRMLGAVPPAEVRSAMLRARALVAPSTWYETFGLVVAEAMAAGLPVIVPKVGALAEVAGAAAVAYTSLSDDDSSRAELVEALQQVRDDGRVDRAGRCGQARYAAEFTREAGLARLIDAYTFAIRSPLAITAASAATRDE